MDFQFKTQFRFQEKCETLSKYYAIAMTYHPAVLKIETQYVLNMNVRTKEVPRWTTIIVLFSCRNNISPGFVSHVFAIHCLQY